MTEFPEKVRRVEDAERSKTVSSAGSVVRGYLKFRANIPPRWTRNARASRKRIEPEIADGVRSVSA